VVVGVETWEGTAEETVECAECDVSAGDRTALMPKLLAGPF
jgi:hypothetical protein